MRNIDWDAPLSEDDKAWLRDRDRHAEVEAHEERFAPGRDSDEGEDDEDADDYDKWKKDELIEEAGSRNPPVDLTGCTRKAEIILAMRSWDLDHPTAE